MGSKKYLVTCLHCKSKRQIGIIQVDGRELIDWLDNDPNPETAKIISGRKRLDNEYGWQCICGNDTILSKQEQEVIHDKANPDPQDILTVTNNLIPEKPTFKMEAL